MIVPGSVNPLLISGAHKAAKLEYALLLNKWIAGRGYLSRTNTHAATDLKKHTASVWLRRMVVSTHINSFFDVHVGGNTSSSWMFHTDNALSCWHIASPYRVTNAKFANTSVWVHFVVVHDGYAAADADRCIIYANGVRQATTGSVAAGQTWWHNEPGRTMNIGREVFNNHGYEGFIADFQMIDGHALSASDFGETVDGRWAPKTYTGAYGNNGWRLKFNDPANIGHDSSGNNNHWTPNNINPATDWSALP